MVLDLGLPDMDGVDVIRGLRGWTTVPIIVLSGRAGSQDKVDALDAGADDYVTKPFGIDELLARIRAVTRRAAAQDEPAGPRPDRRRTWSTWPTARRSCRARSGSTPTEWQLLEILRAQPRQADQPAPAAARGVGRPATRPRPTTCASTWPSCAASSNADPARPATCSPSRAWATASPPEPAPAARGTRPGARVGAPARAHLSEGIPERSPCRPPPRAGGHARQASGR